MEVRHELHLMLNEHELWDAPLLVLANKQDAPDAKSSEEIADILNLYSLGTRIWYIAETKATHPDTVEANLHAGLDWLRDTLLLPASQRAEKARLETRKWMSERARKN